MPTMLNRKKSWPETPPALLLNQHSAPVMCSRISKVLLHFSETLVFIYLLPNLGLMSMILQYQRNSSVLHKTAQISGQVWSLIASREMMPTQVQELNADQMKVWPAPGYYSPGRKLAIMSSRFLFCRQSRACMNANSSSLHMTWKLKKKNKKSVEYYIVRFVFMCVCLLKLWNLRF